MTQAKFFIVAGALFGAIAVICGAFGAHALESTLTSDALETWDTGASYNMYHALLLLFIGSLANRTDIVSLHVAGWLVFAGILVFSGSLYILVLSGQKWLGAITPIGGLSLILGWGGLLYASLTQL
jgi:uncharacterized membrane protein YgdD (TMEM256/DUF423 family)